MGDYYLFTPPRRSVIQWRLQISVAGSSYQYVQKRKSLVIFHPHGELDPLENVIDYFLLSFDIGQKCPQHIGSKSFVVYRIVQYFQEIASQLPQNGSDIDDPIAVPLICWQMSPSNLKYVHRHRSVGWKIVDVFKWFSGWRFWSFPSIFSAGFKTVEEQNAVKFDASITSSSSTLMSLISSKNCSMLSRVASLFNKRYQASPKFFAQVHDRGRKWNTFLMNFVRPTGLRDVGSISSHSPRCLFVCALHTL